MATRSITYQLDGADITLGVDEAGAGPTVLLLPALSSISTRAEMRPLMDRLDDQFRVVTVDWPGFGDRPRPRLDWTPDILSGFLDRFARENAPGARAIVAAGHAASYVLYAASRNAASRPPGLAERIVLLAPTWRGPFPTMVGGYRPWFARVRGALDHPLIGPPLYRLNVSGPVLEKMAREHVYSDPALILGEEGAQKQAVTWAPGARHASVRFVTGALDRVESRGAFHDLARRARAPLLVIYGAETPPKSRAEIEAMGDLPNVRLERLPRGKLAVHEEFPDEVAALVLPFLDID